MTNKRIKRRDFLRTVGAGATAAALGCGDSVRSVPKERPPAEVSPTVDTGEPKRAAHPTATEAVVPRPAETAARVARRPNVLLITTDDLGWDSVGAYGCEVEGITPNIDRLASEGVRFEHAHVNIAVCQPCRAVLATGRYSHRNGVIGFEHTERDIPTVMQTLQDAGYATGVLSKAEHSTPHKHFRWDLVATKKDMIDGRSPERYFEYTKRFIETSRTNDKPFYLMANSQDPHRPFANSKEDAGSKAPSPSRLYRPREIQVPGFLPNLPDVRKEVACYFNSVRRADDTVGELLRALKESGEEENTVVVFISDHGMSFPFAKANCYPQSTRIPWIVRWPGVAKAGAVDRDHVISTIDFLPSVLEAVGLPAPDGMDGVSFVPLLKGETQENRDLVFTQFHKTVKKDAYPMRCVQDKRHCYIFNPWADGERTYRAEAMHGLTFKAMKKAAERNPAIARRVELYRHRVLEELYDLVKDPYCLTNLADRPAHGPTLERLRATLAGWMKDKGDPALACFEKRRSRAVCEELVRSLDKV